jgi:hypothetical protein
LEFEDAGISKENGYLPFVIPKEKRDIYMNLLADCDIEGMKKFIEGLMKDEEKRMVEFGIDTEKFGLEMNVDQ